MMKIFKSRLFIFILGGIIFGSITGVVAYTINAKDVLYTPKDNNWNVKNVEEAINDIKSKGLYKKICKLVDGNPLEIGSKYECNPSLDGTTKYNFYIIRVDNDNIKLIMERNISDFVGSSRTMNWQSAMNFFRNGAGTSLNWKVPVELPRAQDIADAVGNTSWNLADKSRDDWFCLSSLKHDYSGYPYCNDQSNKKYLFDYTRECSNWGCSNSLDSSYAYGYWTGDSLTKDTLYIWFIRGQGYLGYVDIKDTSGVGVRPVIIINKSNII